MLEKSIFILSRQFEFRSIISVSLKNARDFLDFWEFCVRMILRSAPEYTGYPPENSLQDMDDKQKNEICRKKLGMRWEIPDKLANGKQFYLGSIGLINVFRSVGRSYSFPRYRFVWDGLFCNSHSNAILSNEQASREACRWPA